MSALLKISTYIGFVMVFGALLSVPLYELGQWAIETDLIPALKPFRFPKYLNRAVLVAALIGLWPFLKSLGLNGWSSLGIYPNEHRWRDLMFGVLVSALGLLGVCVWLLLSDRLSIRPQILPMWFISAFATAVAVSILEEFFFRGALFGVLLRQFSVRTAALVLSVIFACLHFIKPHPSVKHWEGEMHWWTGFEVLSYSFWQFGEPRLVIGGLLTLFLVGLVLAYATLQTRSLFLAMGIHAGWVFVLRLVQMGTVREAAPDWLVGKPLITGIVPCVLVALTGGLLVWYFRSRPRSNV